MDANAFTQRLRLEEKGIQCSSNKLFLMSMLARLLKGFKRRNEIKKNPTTTTKMPHHPEPESIYPPFFFVDDATERIKDIEVMYRKDESVITRSIQNREHYGDYEGENRISLINYSIGALYLTAYSGMRRIPREKSRVLLEVRDSIKRCVMLTNQEMFAMNDIEMEKWLIGNAYCYETIVPDYYSGKYDTMLNDLNSLFSRFNLTGIIEKRTVICLALQSRGGNKHDKYNDNPSFRSKGEDPEVILGPDLLQIKNLSFDELLKKLNTFHTSIPFINQTNYPLTVDIELRGNLYDMNDVNRALRGYNLHFVETDTDMDMLVMKPVKEEGADEHELIFKI